MKKFIIEFNLQYDCTEPSVYEQAHLQRYRRRLSNKAGTTALRKYLKENNSSPFHSLSFDKYYTIDNTWSDEYESVINDETNQLRTVISDIQSQVAPSEDVVLHFWGHANDVLIGCTEYGILFRILKTISCRHLFVNLMNSCNTYGARPYCDERTTIWYSTGGVPDSSSDNFDISDKFEDYRLPSDWDHDFDIPFLIYDCYSTESNSFDFDKYIRLVSEHHGIVDLYGEINNNCSTLE